MLKKIYNLRPYSWVDLILIGLVAKISIERSLDFFSKDVFMLIGLLSLWFFFNLILEARHGYSYRAKTNIFIIVILLIVPIITGSFFNLYSNIFVLSSTLLISVYLLKNKNSLLGGLSPFIRGLIQSQYYLYSLMFYTTSIELNQIFIALIILIIYSMRAIVGDIRDYKHNKEANKKTLVVSLGLNLSTIIIFMLVILSVIIILIISNIYVAIPLILFSISLLFYKNGYVLHQLFIFVTSFISINFIVFFLNGNLLFTNLIFLGVIMNLIFYPLLERKSNPISR